MWILGCRRQRWKQEDPSGSIVVIQARNGRICSLVGTAGDIGRGHLVNTGWRRSPIFLWGVGYRKWRNSNVTLFIFFPFCLNNRSVSINSLQLERLGHTGFLRENREFGLGVVRFFMSVGHQRGNIMKPGGCMKSGNQGRSLDQSHGFKP